MNNARQKERQTIYAFARCEQFLEDYARSNQLPSLELTERVADLLLAQTRREVLGTEHHLSSLRGDGTEGNQTARTLAVARGSHRKAQVRRSDFGKPKDPKRFNFVVKQVAMGHSTAVIAKKLGISLSGLYAYCKARHIRLNPSPKGPHA